MNLLLALTLVCAAQGAPELKAGFAAADITPEAGAEMPGGFGKHISKGTRDKLWAVAAVVSDGTNHVALVGIDALFTPKEMTAGARARIEKATKIPGTNVLISASHTHVGGPIQSCFGSEADPKYVERVSEAVAAAVEEAWKGMQPVEIGVGKGKEDTIAHNRRFLMKNGKEITHPGKPGTPNHDQIVRSAGPVDPDVGVLAARKPNGAVTGVVVNFTCHCTVIGGSQFSADYVGFLRKHLQSRYGDQTPVVFLQGACGDITQVDNLAIGRESGPEHAELMGMKLATEAARTIGRMTWKKDYTVAGAIERVPIPIRAEPNVDAERPAFGLGGGPNAEPVYAKERIKVAEQRAKEPILNCEVQGIRIGPLGIATNGAEYFVEYGLRIKQASPHAQTWFVGYANDYIGYVATAQAFVAGGYEVRTAWSSRLAPEGGQQLVEGALKVLNQVK